MGFVGERRDGNKLKRYTNCIPTVSKIVPVWPWGLTKIFLLSKIIISRPQHVQNRWIVEFPLIKYKFKSEKKCLGCHKTAFSRRKRVFILKPQKDDQKIVRIRDVGNRIPENIPNVRARWVRKTVATFSCLIQLPLGSCAILGLFCPNDFQNHCSPIICSSLLSKQSHFKI